MLRLNLKQDALTPFAYAVLYTVASLVLYQKPLLDYALPRIDIGSRDGLTILFLLEFVQGTLTVAALTLIGVLSVRLMKVVGASVMLVNAAVLYYMATYGVVIDPTMVGNILNTNSGEAGGLMHPKLFLWVALLGILPAAIALWIPVRRRSIRSLGSVFALLVALAGAVWAGAGVWLWFDDHNSNLGPRMLPWNYIGNSLRYAQASARRNRAPHLLPAPQLEPLSQNTLVVVVIGEAARPDHLAFFGYERDTNPFTRDLGLLAFPGGRSCTTYTIGSVACILSPRGSSAEVDDPWEPLPSYAARAGVDTLVRINNSGTPLLPGVLVESSDQLATLCQGADCPAATHDAVLLNGLPEWLSQPAERRLLVLHFNGSHGPEYFRKYPEDFEVFTPVCETTLVRECTTQELVNAYDNSIRYTDWVMAQLIADLEAVPDTAILVLYVSDHGQSLGENGVYLHGLPNAIAPDEQRRIPFLVWMNDAFATAHALDRDALLRPEPDPQNMIFDTALGALGIGGDAYDPSRDLMRPESR